MGRQLVVRSNDSSPNTRLFFSPLRLYTISARKRFVGAALVVEFTAVELLLKTQDYCLIRRFLDHNIAAPPRSLLPAITRGAMAPTHTEQAAAAVNYGYEDRDGPPTTFCLGVKLDLVSVLVGVHFTRRNSNFNENCAQLHVSVYFDPKFTGVSLRF